MLILHVIIGLNIGGAELMLQRLVTAPHAHAGKYSHSVISLTDDGPVGEELANRGIPVISLGMTGILDIPAVFIKLRREIIRQQPDIIQTWMYHADLLGGLSARTVGKKNIIWGIRTTALEHGGNRQTLLVRKLCALLSHSVPKFIVCAANASRSVHERVGYCANKMVVIPNGFDAEKWEPNDITRTARRSEWGLNSQHIAVGSVGRYHPVKDHSTFVRAAGDAAKHSDRLKFVLIGRGLDAQNKALMRLIDETGTPERFILLGERSDIADCLNGLDIFCLHSRTEGFPNALGEAMAAAKPCISTDVGDARYLLGDTGFIVRSGSSTEIADAMLKVANLPDSERHLLGAKARQRILDCFTMTKSFENFARLYDHFETTKS